MQNASVNAGGWYRTVKQTALVWNEMEPVKICQVVDEKYDLPLISRNLRVAD